MKNMLVVSIFMALKIPPSNMPRKELTGFDRLREIKSACDITEEEAALIFPAFAKGSPEEVSMQRCLNNSIQNPESAAVKTTEELSGKDPIECRLGGLKGAENRLAANRDKMVPDAKPKQLHPLAKKRFEDWQRSHHCFKNISEVREIISDVHIQFEEICKSKGLAALPPYMIFKNARDQELVSDGENSNTKSEAAKKPDAEKVIQIYSPEFADYIAKDFASSKVAKAASDAEARNGSSSATTTVSVGGNLGASVDVKPVGVGASVSASGQGGLDKSWTKTSPQPLDFDKIEKEAYDIAIKRPAITGYPPDFECKGDKCRNTSNNVWFPKSEAPKKIGCTPEKNCKTDPNYDEEAKLAGCVEVEVSNYYKKIGKLTYDPDLKFMDAIEESNPDADLKLGYCDIHKRGEDFCRTWKAQLFQYKTAPWIVEQVEKDAENAKSLLENHGVCDTQVFGVSYCNNFESERRKKRIPPTLEGEVNTDVLRGEKPGPVKISKDELDPETFVLEPDLFKTIAASDTSLGSYCLKLLEENKKRVVPQPLSKLFSPSNIQTKDCAELISPTIDIDSMTGLGKCIKTGQGCDGSVGVAPGFGGDETPFELIPRGGRRVPIPGGDILSPFELVPRGGNNLPLSGFDGFTDLPLRN